jgi:ATP-dependent Clp protease ATP-binding subunit ClpC
MDIENAREKWENSIKERNISVEMVEEVIEQVTGIPVSKMKESDLEDLQNMEPALREVVIGQDSAVSSVARAFRRARFKLKKEKRPISFLFTGPTGVGKSHLVRQLAKYVFGSDANFFKFDMSEYSERHTVSRLIGAPPGFVGYEEGGQLTEKIRRKPWAVILLDEIEKAHSDIYNVLLQALEDGVLTDGLGRECNLKNTIIVMTSNVGARVLADFGVGVGFNTAAKQASKREIESAIFRKELGKKFPKEFINRIDEIVQFNSLEKRIF